MSKRTYMKFTAIALAFMVIATQIFSLSPVMLSTAAVVDYFSPFDVVYSPDGTMIAVSDNTKAKLNIITASTGAIARSIQLNGKPKGIAWNGNTRVYVAEYDAGSVAEIDPAAGTVLNRILTGPKPSGVAVKSDKLLVTDFGLNYVSIVDLTTRAILGNVAVKSYPFFVDITTNGLYAIVGHATPNGDATTASNASTVTFIDIAAKTVSTNIALPAGSTNVRAVKCSPDGKWAYVAHTVGRTAMPTTQITKGWTNTDGISIIDVANKNLYTTVLLDTLMEGAADPWGITVSADSKTLWVSISGTHQVYKLDLYNLHLLLLGTIPGSGNPTLLQRSKAAFAKPYSDIWFTIKATPAKRTLLVNDLGALWSAGLLTKIKMPGQGPRGLSVAPNGAKIAVGSYYAGQVYMIDNATNAVTQTISLGTQPAEDAVRRGDRTYHDASTTLQKWLSCATCHPEGRADGLNWDMPNDGIGNTKNTKSHFKAFETPPSMWRGIRADAATGVNAGFKYIKFKTPTQQELDDVAAYIQSFTEERSPYRNSDGTMTADAVAGKVLFESSATQCSTCHYGSNFTDSAVALPTITTHDVGTKDQWDIDGQYVTAPLGELWRSAPYLHDGSATTMRAVLTTKNVGDKHGKTSQLTSAQIDQLAAYLLQLEAGIVAPDTQAPTAPTNLATTGKTDTTVSLSWTGSTDNIAVTGYNIYNGAALAATVGTTTGIVTGLTANTAYTFTIKAKDASGNLSAASNALAVTTNATTTPTNVAQGKTASAGSSETANPAVNGNDGSTTTRWCASSGSVPQWWMVNLGGKYNLTGSEVTWELNGKVYKYKIETSPDNVTWTTASDKTANTATTQVQADTFTAANVQYVRINITGLDTGVWASFFEFKVFGTVATQTPATLSRTGMTATTTSYETGEDAARVLDGNNTTLWHTKWDLSNPLPQSVTINLNGTYTVSKLRYLPRQDANNNGIITGYNVYVSSDGTNFGSAVATGTWAADATEKSASFTGVSARYIRLEATAGNGGWASAAEINVEGY